MKTRFLGLDLIRIWMTFSVVCVHCYRAKACYPDGEPWYVSLMVVGGIAVPVFMTMSFFLTQRHFLGDGWGWLGKRMLRLYVPFAFWAFVTFFVTRAMSGPHVTDPWHCDSTWRSLGIHLIGGTSLAFHLQMWFMGVLCWMTPVVFLLCRPFKGRLPVRTLAALAVAAVMMQYTGFNKWLFGMIPEFGIRIPAGRFFEMVPYVCVGLLVASQKDAIAALSERKRAVFAAIALVFFVFFKYTPVFIKAPGFSYSGLERMSIAFSALAFFYLLPLDRVPGWIAKAASFVARYSMGVYMTHWLVCRLLERWLFPSLGVTAQTLTAAALAFAAAWLASFLIGLIPCKATRALVT